MKKHRILSLLLAAVMLCADSVSSIEDVVFERRFACAEGFAALGGRVNTAGRVLHIRPGGALRGTRLSAPDLRGGAALAVAALQALLARLPEGDARREAIVRQLAQAQQQAQ